MRKQICLTVDVERDCPPFLQGFRGITNGLPKLLALFAQHHVQATFFVTGNIARRFPTAVAQIVANQHELGCHGDTHTDFRRLDRAAAESEIRESTLLLRQFAPVVSFRAPYLQFPNKYISILTKNGFQTDSSQARYKPPYGVKKLICDQPIYRIPASMTSSMLRLPTAALRFWLNGLQQPAVLFVHPWEFVDLTQEDIRFDCRWRTGDIALKQLDVALVHLKKIGWQFVTMSHLRQTLTKYHSE